MYLFKVTQSQALCELDVLIVSIENSDPQFSADDEYDYFVLIFFNEY